MSDSRDLIQARLLADIDDSYNKSEGEFLYDAEKPVAIELEAAYKTIEKLPNISFADTAEGKDLDKVVNKFGVYRKGTTQSNGVVTITGNPEAQVAKGELVATDTLSFMFTETKTIPSSGIIDVNVKCKTYGKIGNIPAGAIKYFPKTLNGLQTVKNINAFTNGYDEEDDDSLRERYYAKIQNPVTSANKAQFKNWALEVTGVGDAKVIPLWNGNGTVKIIIINSNKVGADSILVKSVQDYIDPNMNGDGSGKMPTCGAICTVASAAEKTININVNIETSEDIDAIKPNIENSIKNYLENIAFKQDYVSYAKIGALIIEVDGVIDYTNLTINNTTSNISISDVEVAVLGGVVLG